jgi:BirA family biotin operon repressor/biotin-[acetyl-CoA-carboxylase] ligase
VPADVEAQATSIERETRRDHEDVRVERDAVLVAVVDALGQWRARLERQGFEPVRARWTALAGMLGREVRVEEIVGIARGLDTDGALLVETTHGLTRVLAGDVV